MKVIAMNNVPVKLWVDQLDAHAWEEVNNLTTLPFLFHHLALQPLFAHSSSIRRTL